MDMRKAIMELLNMIISKTIKRNVLVPGRSQHVLLAHRRCSETRHSSLAAWKVGKSICKHMLWFEDRWQ